MTSVDASHAPRHLGVTPPINQAEPTAAELEFTASLTECLRGEGQFEPEEDARRRELVLTQLSKIFADFVKNVSIKRGMPEAAAIEAGGKIFTFGSYRLGVHAKGADIDTLCVAPRHISRDDFFGDLFEVLKATPEITELTKVEDAYVPVIKFCFSEIPIDLVFARLNLPSVPPDLLLFNDNLLRNLDERCVRSLNGSRVTDEILRLVPNVPAFRLTLRCIKLWAKQRAIYSNVMGFLGGVAWAMLVARVCQLYPNATASVLVGKFFRIMHQWKWPQPVILKNIEEGPLQVRVWNPKLYPSDKAHRMPIITPAYPSMCATHNVTHSTQAIMTREFERGAKIVENILDGNGQWKDLFQNHDFFYDYRYYLQIVASSDSEETQLKWSGMVESRLRQLVLRLELVDGVQLAHPFIKAFEKVTVCHSDQEAFDVGHGEFPKRPIEEKKEEEKKANESVEKKEEPNNESETNDDAKDGEQQSPESTSEFKRTMYTSIFYVGLQLDTQKILSKQLDIGWPTNEFTKLVKSWEHYDATKMGIVVKYIKSHLLPEDVFEGDDAEKVLKRKKGKNQRPRSNGDEKSAKKRKANEPTTTINGTAAPTAKDTLGTVANADKMFSAPASSNNSSIDLTMTSQQSAPVNVDSLEESATQIEQPPTTAPVTTASTTYSSAVTRPPQPARPGVPLGTYAQVTSSVSTSGEKKKIQLKLSK